MSHSTAGWAGSPAALVGQDEGGLVASLAGLPGVDQDPVHGPLPGEIDALIQQGGDHPDRAKSTTGARAAPPARLGVQPPTGPPAAAVLEGWTLVEPVAGGPGTASPGSSPAPAGLDGAKVGRDRVDGGHQVARCSWSLAGSSGIPSSSETFPWIWMIRSAWARRPPSRWCSRHSRSASTRAGSAGLGPRVPARAARAPGPRWRRQSTKEEEEYSRSRRSNAPI